ncbi:MAG: family 10 glycosylhydrolase [Candidatus Sumerlaeia bacterium]
MRTQSICHLLAPLVLLWAAAAAGLAQPVEAPTPNPPEADEETTPVRSAIWLTAEGDWIRESLPVERLVGEVRGLAFEEVIVQVVENGSAYYNSKQLSKALGLTANFDPLARLAADLHKGPRKKAVIAWIDPFHVGNVNSPLPVQLLAAAPDRMNWLTRNDKDANQTAAGDRYLEPGLPEVRALMAQVIAELAKYPIDGIYIDPMCDPGPEWGYHPAMLQRFQSETGRADRPAPNDPAWISFRSKVISEALEEFVKAARSVRRDIVVSVGAEAVGKAPANVEAFKDSAVYAGSHQNWPRWLRDSVVPRVYVKNFRGEQQDADQFLGWLNFALAVDKDAKGIAYVGVGGNLNDSISALRQMQRVALSGAYGMALYSFQNPERDPGVRDLFFDAIAETALSGAYVARMRQLAENPRNADRETTTTTDAELQLPPPPSIEEGQATRLIPVIKDQELATARQLAGIDQPTTASVPTRLDEPTTTVKAQSTPRPNPPRTRREMLLDMLKKEGFAHDRDTEPIRPSAKSEEYLKGKFSNVFENE